MSNVCQRAQNIKNNNTLPCTIALKPHSNMCKNCKNIMFTIVHSQMPC
uniref:Uncharacterized protein n=1 Tax=Anguilla anguilla TaxID=7936 RepID=A0A0E9XXU0_ANGAN